MKHVMQLTLLARFFLIIVYIAMPVTFTACQHAQSPLLSNPVEGSELSRFESGLYTHLIIKRSPTIQTRKIEIVDLNASPASPNFAQAKASPATALHVYIDGDGEDAQRTQTLGLFPDKALSTKKHLALELMSKDRDNHTLYLGRPCYFIEDTRCSESDRGTGRYSRNILDSMILTLRAFIQSGNFTYVTLIGYDGGATLALLMATEMPEIHRLVTLSGKLDTDSWSKHHQEKRLSRSYNPAYVVNERTSKIDQLHLFGEKDWKNPAFLSDSTLQKLKKKPVIKQNFTHECCWLDMWPKLLQ